MVGFSFVDGWRGGGYFGIDKLVVVVGIGVVVLVQVLS